MNLVPPTALAFEHTAVLADDVPSEEELTDPGRLGMGDGPPEGTPTPRHEPLELTRLKNRKNTANQRATIADEDAPYATRRSFGVHFDAHEPLNERSPGACRKSTPSR